jgi:hypothetical protein
MSSKPHASATTLLRALGAIILAFRISGGRLRYFCPKERTIRNTVRQFSGGRGIHSEVGWARNSGRGLASSSTVGRCDCVLRWHLFGFSMREGRVSSFGAGPMELGRIYFCGVFHCSCGTDCLFLKKYGVVEARVNVLGQQVNWRIPFTLTIVARSISETGSRKTEFGFS